MIHRLKVKNFYSFKDESEISFIVDGKTPKGDSYVFGDKKRLSKVLTIVGPNASGKTNILKPFSFLEWFLTRSAPSQEEGFLLVKPFLFDNKTTSRPTEMFVEFSINNRTFDYSLSLKDGLVFSEVLKDRGKRLKCLFSRDWDEKSNQYKIDLKNYNVGSDSPSIEKSLQGRRNASLVSIVRQLFDYKHELNDIIFKHWNSLFLNVTELGRHPADRGVLGAASLCYKDNKLRNDVEKILKKFDFGLSGIDVIKRTSTDANTGKKIDFYIPLGRHKTTSNKEEELPFDYESSGTKNLFALLPGILRVLEAGGLVVLDEFDADLHPSIVNELVEIFNSKSNNPKNAQLLFSTHSLQVLDILDKYQILLTSKNKLGESQVYRLDQIKGVRADDNYLAKYISGKYGAIPKID